MSRYLDKFVSTMPQNQARYVFEFLTEMKNQGAIRTVDEYNNQLRVLTAELKQEEIKPIFKIFLALIGDIIDSGRFNAMVKAIAADLNTAFQESNQLVTVLDLHKSLYKLTVLKALRTGVQNLKRKINMYEFLNKDTNGFSDGQFETFDEAGHAMSRTNALATQLFYDPKTKMSIGEEYDLELDLAGQRLTLPYYINRQVNITDISLVRDADTIESIRDIQLPESNLRNVIDNTKFTYWTYPVLLTSAVTTGVKCKVKLVLGEAMQEINMLEIEPAKTNKMVLESLIYFTTDGVTHTLQLNEDILPGKTKRISFQALLADEIQLIFRQDNYEFAGYYYKQDQDLWERVVENDLDPEESDQERLNRLAEELNNTVDDSQLAHICGIPDRAEWEEVAGVQYSFGFDNIKVYNIRYKNKGVYVSKKLTVSKPGLIALRASETHPAVTLGNSDYNYTSIEYYLLKRNFDEAGGLIDSENIPLVPLESYQGDSLTVSRERLLLAEKSATSAVKDVVKLRFVPKIDTDNSIYPRFYKNVIDELSIKDDFQVRVGGGTYCDTWSDVATDISNNKNVTVPLIIRVKFLEPSVVSFYTTSYVIEEDYKITDYITMKRNGIFACDITRDKGDPPVEKSDLYVIVIMRKNYVPDTETCILEDYRLLLASHNPGRFE